MKSFKNFLYLVFALYLVLSILLILYSDSILGSLNIVNDVGFWSGWLMGGLLLFIVEVLVENAHVSQLQRQVARLQREVNEVKARYYDDLATSQRPEQKKSRTIIPGFGRDKAATPPPPATNTPPKSTQPPEQLPPHPYEDLDDPDR
ncbi:hypothetical protein SAMN05421823_103398 [Catalinimonas alkaloidigena]|uniref:Lipopolysaccharide assembly protein A domain-containing protein n=1 Tax=Catalinimonas alkaloidigena TaxID=1075417 RepID=A0A1G9E9Y1_9BACT|nr:hypothetical protein [Catalinimonas alkaloidigena]SDK72970.1 hypothetical protein SAMN05421823_103398 [Catalinimonas alkaloidigena]